MKIEYDAKNNRFPFFAAKDRAMSVSFDHQDELCELDFVYDKITSKYPLLNADIFYKKIEKIQKIKNGMDNVTLLKRESDSLLKNIRNLL